MRTAFIALRAMLVSALFVSLWTWLAVMVRRYDARWDVALPEWGSIPGLILLVLGCALMVTCVVTFVVIGEGTPAPLDPPQKFVAQGVYRYVRNPMYIGGVIALLGLGLFWRSPGVLLLAAGFWLCFAGFVVGVEEPMLRAKFGEEYQAYCRRVSRWLPKPPG